MPGRYRDPNFWVVVAMVLIAIGIIFFTYSEMYPVETPVGPLPFHHWMSISGASIITVLIPAYILLKRYNQHLRKSLFKIHIYGNLFAFLLISIHFAHHTSEGIDPVIDTGTGFLQYGVVLLLITTGIIRRFQFASVYSQAWRFLHAGLTISFYLIIINHIIRALRLG